MIHRSTRRATFGVTAIIAVSLVACGGGQSTTSPSGAESPLVPTLPAPRSFPVSITFANRVLEVREGASASIPVHYRVRELTSPYSLRVSLLLGTAGPEDVTLEGDSVEVPAGQNASGVLTLDLTAIADVSLAEGDETATVRFVPDSAVDAELGDDLSVVIREAGASPCAGVRVMALPPSPAESGRPPGLATTMRIQGGDETWQEGIHLHFAGPFFRTSHLDRISAPPASAVNVAAWRTSGFGNSTVHELDIEWPDEGPLPAPASPGVRDWYRIGSPNLRLGFSGSGCDARFVTCSDSGCELVP